MDKKNFITIGIVIIVIIFISNQEIQKYRPSSEDLYSYALQIVNDDRKNHNVSPVTLSNITSAQNHADDMLKENYYSNWNANGVKSYVTYTELGGRGKVVENMVTSRVYCENLGCFLNPFDPFKEIKNAEYNMVYNDSDSNWWHRDNIISPLHTDVNFGIAYDNNNFYFVEHFEDNLIKWKKIGIENDTKLRMVGTITGNLTFSGINIYLDPSARTLSGFILNSEAPYNLTSYDNGKPEGLIIDNATYFQYRHCPDSQIGLNGSHGIVCVNYAVYDNNSTDSNRIDVTADVSKWLGREGLHTIYVVLNDKKGTSIYATSLTLEYLK